jgi:hypothetical protein
MLSEPFILHHTAMYMKTMLQLFQETTTEIGGGGSRVYTALKSFICLYSVL